jgi:hypothetical protein
LPFFFSFLFINLYILILSLTTSKLFSLFSFLPPNPSLSLYLLPFISPFFLTLLFYFF